MLDSVKQFITLKSIDKNINAKNYDLALEKLNMLVQSGFCVEEAYLKRGLLCHKLLMNEDAYSDLTYVIGHFPNNMTARRERMILNFEMSNYIQAVYDADAVLQNDVQDYDAVKIKITGLIYLSRFSEAKDFLDTLYNNKYRSIQLLLTETAICVTQDSFGNALKILEFIDYIDKDNPIKLLKEANIYGLAGNQEKQQQIMEKIRSVFPKYFISHFRFTDIYEERDLLEVSFLLELRVFDTQNLFAYPLEILEGYKNNMEGRILDSKECFERAIQINPNKADAYVLLGETLQLMSGYDNTEYRQEAEKNYQKALEIYTKENLPTKIETMKRQIRHLNSGLFESGKH